MLLIILLASACGAADQGSTAPFTTGAGSTNAQAAYISSYSGDIDQLQPGTAEFPTSLKVAVGHQVTLDVVVEDGTLTVAATSTPGESTPVSSSVAVAHIESGGRMEVDAVASDSSVAISPPKTAILPVLAAGERNTWSFQINPADNGNFVISLSFIVYDRDTTDVLWQSDPDDVPDVDLTVSDTFAHGFDVWGAIIGKISALVAALAAILTAIIPSWRQAVGRLFKRRVPVKKQPGAAANTRKKPVHR